MKRKSTITMTGLVALVASLAVSFAIRRAGRSGGHALALRCAAHAASPSFFSYITQPSSGVIPARS